MKYESLIGEKYNHLTIKNIVKKHIYKKDGKPNGNKYICECLCDCGNIKNISIHHLINGHTKSCGCLLRNTSKERMKKLNLSHGMSGKNKIYNVWQTMKARCFNKNNCKYKNYGGRGIKVCEEWKNNFKNFYDWAISNGYKENLTIDRIDVNGNYYPENCRWITLKEQARNKRNTIYVYYNKEKVSLKSFCEITKIKYEKAYYEIVKMNRIYCGLTIAK